METLLRSDCEVASFSECPSRMPLALTNASENFFRRKPNATINDYANFVESVATRSTTDNTRNNSLLAFHGRVQRPSLVSKEWFKRACHWVSMAARCHLRDSLGRSDADLRAYQRAWKALYFAPFRGPQARPLLSLLYAGAAAPRVHACLTIMADVFEGAAFSVAKHVLQEAVHDLEGSLSQLGRDARLVHFVDKDEQHLLIVSPGLLGLFMNVSSSVEPVLVPAIEKPILRAMLTDRKPEGPSHAVPTALLLGKLSHCFATWVNVSEPLSAEVAAEALVLDPLFQLYRKALVGSTGENTLLHRNYTNAQLFFHLWAHCHCGKEEGRVLVNAVARNSLLFSRTFRCTASKAMAYEDTCSLYNQL
ncbi:hypothetical protein HPB50_014068 [Hyalomma asiaticum]|uniref:Uncharacterized protein n=1 Tax=Hyalomma asiaticum TaxID=266040 RepID=A0ACB7RQZ7_HYAAI|nr:hypothetical protein HPB50_014068 [Hyalomma asiaticum]